MSPPPGAVLTIIVIDVKHFSGAIDRMPSHDGRMDLRVLESCHSTWLFDSDRMRFRRILKDPSAAEHLVATAWRPYYGLEIDPHSESFMVMLNPEGTRLLRSWRHTHDCAQCGGHVTAQLSLAELRGAVIG